MDTFNLALDPQGGFLKVNCGGLSIDMTIKDLDQDLSFITEALILYKNKLIEKKDRDKERRF